ncbi:MAG: TolC family protein [Pseudomonadota bacterium]
MLATLLFCSLAAQAQEPLSLAEAVARAMAHNPDLAQSALALTQAESQVLSARAAFEPTFQGSGGWDTSQSRGFFQGFGYTQDSSAWSASAGFAGSLPSGTSWSLGSSAGWNRSETTSEMFSGAQSQEYGTSGLQLGLRQNLLEGLSPSYNLRGLRTARQGVERAQTNLAWAREQLVVGVAAAWRGWVLTLRREAIAAEALQTAGATERTVQARTEEGRATELELGQASLARLQARADLLQAQADTRAAADDLLVLLGEEPGADVAPAGRVLPAAFALGPLDAWEERALAANAELALARADVEAARLTARDAGHARLPSLAAQASASLGAQADDVGGALGGLGSDDAYPAWGAGLDLSVPLGNRAARAEIQRTHAALQAATLAVEGLERSLRAEVQARFRAVLTAQEALEIAEASRALAARNASLEEVRYLEGTRTLDRLLDARLEAERAALTAEQAQVTLAAALLDLQALAGEAESSLTQGS